MYYSFLEIFAIGIGPSSSHTVGPMKAAKRYVDNLIKQNKIEQVARVEVSLYGSLALTGIGHGTDKAVIYGLMGLEAEQVDPTVPYINAVERDKIIHLGQKKAVAFDKDKDIIYEKTIFLPEHSNGMRFKTYDENNNVKLSEELNDKIKLVYPKDTQELEKLFANFNRQAIPRIFVGSFPDDFSQNGSPALFAKTLS